MIVVIIFILLLISLWFQLQDERTIVGKGLFKKETNIEVFLGLQVELSTGRQRVKSYILREYHTK